MKISDSIAEIMLNLHIFVKYSLLAVM